MIDLSQIDIPNILSIAGVLSLLANLWIARKLSPITNTVDLLKQRLEYLENESKRREPLMDRMTRVEEQSKANGESLKTIELKVDRLLER